MRAIEKERLSLYLRAGEDWLGRVKQSGTQAHAIASEISSTVVKPPFITVSGDDTITDLYARMTAAKPQKELFFPGRLRHSPSVMPVIIWLANHGSPYRVLLRYGDSTEPVDFPALVKVRKVSRPGSGLLSPFDWPRHFEPLLRLASSDRPWSDKRNELVWRGATTGPDKGHDSRHSRAWICEVANRNASNSSIDVAYTAVGQGSIHWQAGGQIAQWQRPHLPMRKQLEAKYLLSLEGNDVASGLKWMMGSQSCVLMPEPTVESWFCESLLEPWNHYVPVEKDLSDIEEKLDWCSSHDDASRAIGENGSRFAQQFTNAEIERSLFDEVMLWWVSQPLLREVVEILNSDIYTPQVSNMRQK